LLTWLPPSSSRIYRLVNFQTSEREQREKKWSCRCISSTIIFFLSPSLPFSVFLLSVIVERKEKNKTEGRNNRRQLEQMARWFIWAENWVYNHYVIILMTWRFDRWYDDYLYECQNSKQETDLINLFISYEFSICICSIYKIFISVWSLSFFFLLFADETV